MVLIASGHFQSIMNYRQVCDSISWKITTLHTFKSRPYTLLQDDEVTKLGRSQTLTNLPSHVFIADPVFLAPCCLNNAQIANHLITAEKAADNSLKYSHQNIELTIEDDPRMVTLALLDTQANRKELDAVTGFFQTVKVSHFRFSDTYFIKIIKHSL